MAQQQQNITISAPGFQGLNTEDSPLQQDPSFCLVADNAVVDKFGRVGSRKAWDEFTTAINVTYSTHGSTTRTEFITNRLGNGVANGTRVMLASVSVFQYDAGDALLQSDFFICKLTEASADVWELDEVTLPTLTDDSKLQDCQFVGYNDAIYIFSQGNECMKYDGTSLSLLFTGTIDVDYIPPTDDSGVIASAIDGDIATAAFGRMWVAGVNGDYETIYYSDLLIAEQWYDGRAVPADAQNTAGIIDVAQYWPNGRDRIVALAAHNNFLFVFGRQSILVYSGLAGDPADVSGARLEDSIPGIGCVARDAVTNIGSDLLFVDDSGVRSAGRTIQEKSVPLGDLTANIRRDITDQIAQTADKSSISLCYWADENLTVLLFSNEGLAYAMEMRQPSQTGGLKVTRWTDCRFNRSCYWETPNRAYVLLAANQDSKGFLAYDGYLQYDAQPYEFKYESNALTFNQPANEKFIKQIDYTIVATQVDADAWAGWGFSGRLDYTKQFTVAAQTPALFGQALFNVDQFGPGLTTIRRYRINTKGRGESVIVGLRTNITGNSCSLQELNMQTLIGRII